ncbi:MAG: hypothetical protein E6J79_05780 [Deltaproteobacteria bacterium]|nr:MAG: hypothetical protein E6J79_05780 [Deltaproteobacteria bacterium]
MCADSIAACIATQGFRTECVRQTTARCRREGPSVCAPGTAVVTVLRPPTSLDATATATDAIHLSWADGGLDVGFSVERSVDGTSFSEIGSTLRNVTSYSDGGLAAATTYYYRVRSLGPRGTASDYSNVASATTLGTDASAPSTPTGLTASASRCGQVDLAWTASTDAGSGVMAYNLYRDGFFLGQVMAPATTTADTNVGVSTPYSYVVSAVDHAGNHSGMSAAASVMTSLCRTVTTTIATTTTTTTSTTIPRDTTAPSVPAALSASAASCSQVNLGWSAATDTGGSGLRGYNLYRGSAFVKLVPAPATSTTDSPLAASTVYSYTVSAVDNAGNESGRSNTANTNTPSCPDTTAPSVPTGLSASATSCSEVNVGWAAATDTGGSGLKGYNVFRNGTFLTQVLAPATSAVDQGRSPSTAYSYAVVALDNAGNQSAATPSVGATTPACTSNPVLTGFVPAVGTARDVVLDGARGLAFVASAEFGLAVVNVANPSAPVVLGAANPPFYGDRVAVSGSLAVVTGNSLGLKVLDVSSPSAPRAIASLSGTMRDAAVAGQFAYALNVVAGNPARSDLVVIDLRVPGTAAVVGRVTLGLEAAALRVVGTVAYVAAGAAGLEIVDVSNPSLPTVVGTADTPGTATGVAVVNGRAYVADDTALHPSIVGSLVTRVRAVTVTGTRLYALDGGPQFKVIDVANPGAPALLSAVNGLGAQNLDAAGSMVLVVSAQVDTTTKTAGLYVLDASVPTAPRVVGNSWGGFDSWGVAASGPLAVAAGNTFGMKVVDVSVPSAPRALATLPGTVRGVAMAGQFAYALTLVPGNPAHTDLLVVDLRTPAAPAVAGRTTLAGGSDLKVVGSLVYVAAGGAGLQIVDVGNPSAPAVVGTADTPGLATAVAVANGRAYVADDSSLQVIDVANPARPAVVGTLATRSTAVAVAGSRAYVLDGGLQLKIVDVSRPTAPALLSATRGFGAQGLDVAGALAFLATPVANHDPTAGLYVVDVSNASAPQLVKQVMVPGMVRTVSAAVGAVYVGDGAALVDVVTLVP